LNGSRGSPRRHRRDDDDTQAAGRLGAAGDTKRGMVRTSLSEKKFQKAIARARQAQARVTERYPGDSGARQPVHTVYGGAHLFHSETAIKLGELALRALDNYAADAAAFGEAIGISGDVAPKVYDRVRDKLRREPVEDYRIDFEDGYGNRPDEEEDQHAIIAAKQVAAGMVAGTLPPFLGIRIKPLTGELAARSLRTLDVFLTELLTNTDGSLPANFVVTLPKIQSRIDVELLVDTFDQLEDRLDIEHGALRVEFMVETTQSLFDPQGRAALPRLHRAAAGRLTGAHFGTYDYTANCDITAGHQRMRHPACDFAKQMMKVAFAGTGVALSDGATNIMPVGPHKAAQLSDDQRHANRSAVAAAWRLHADDIRHSLVHGFYQGWDLHPAQLVTRYVATYAFFRAALPAATARLAAYLDRTAAGVLDEPATARALATVVLRGVDCGAVDEAEILAAGGPDAASLTKLAGRRPGGR
jgi:hypothetical protein